MTDAIQFDPALKELLLRKTGDPYGESLDPEAPAEQVPVLVRLHDPVAPPSLLQVVASFGNIVTGRVPLNCIVKLRQHPNVASLKASLRGGPELASSVPEIQATPAALRRMGIPGYTGCGAIVAVVDWGCDFAHANFRDQQGHTRLLYLWDQRSERTTASPSPYGYGREFSREQIDAALSQADPYEALGYDPAQIDPRGRGTHGTHVLDIAAGNGRAPGSAPGVAPGADLMFVHLRADDTLPQGTLGDSVRLLEAVHYVLDRAGDRPVVINLSMGKTGGPKDASTLVEQALDTVLEEAAGRAICMSTGNYFEAELHTQGRLGRGQTVELLWQALPRNDEFAEMEIWYRKGDAFTVELIDPYGRTLNRAALGDTVVVRQGERIVASMYNRRGDPNNGDNQIDLFLWPDAPVGHWTVKLHGDQVQDGTYHAWIERESPATQSRFHPNQAVRTTTINTICGGRKTISVGAYDARVPTTPMVSFSSSGPSRDGRQIPFISAPGAGIRAARSSYVNVLGHREMHGTTIKSGSSMAAPHATGVVALMWEAAGTRRLHIDQVRDILARTARQSPPFDAEGRLRYGAGRIDAAAAVQAVVSMHEAKAVHVAMPVSAAAVPLKVSAGDNGRPPALLPQVQETIERYTMTEQMIQPPFAAVGPGFVAEEVYAPSGGLNYTPASNAGIFRCAPNPVAVSPATHLPQPSTNPDDVSRTALARNGCSAAQVAAFEQRGGLAPLQPIARFFGVEAMAELLGRLRYTPARLVNPYHTYGNRLQQTLGTQHAAPHLVARLLLAIPGHFRELARRAPDAHEAFVLENLGWLLMRSLRYDLRGSGFNYWLPPAPRFVVYFPNPVPAASRSVQRLILRRLLIDTSLAQRDYHAFVNLWSNSLAGRAWRLETGRENSNAGARLPFYAQLANIPGPVNTATQRQQIDNAWAQRLAATDAQHTPHTNPSTLALRRCSNVALPQGLIQRIRLPGLRLAYNFPIREGEGTITSVRVLNVIRPTVERLLETVRDLGWNDLWFQTSGSFCFRGIKLRPSSPNYHARARVLSNHGYGLAVDVNVVDNPRGESGTMDPRIVALFEAFHFGWGGCFGDPDPHHFEYCGGAC
jgi:subtilisin family serine protease